MNRTLLLIIVDFLFLNLIALTRWEKVEPARPQQPPVPAVAANAPTAERDLVETMRQSLVDEQAVQRELTQKLAQRDENLAAREQGLSQLQTEKSRLAATLTETQRSATELNREIVSAREESHLTRDQLAQLQRELAEKIAEAERQRHSIENLEQDRAKASKQIEGLTMAVVVGEAEKESLQKQATQLQNEVQSERSDRIKVEENTARLAQDVGQMAQSSGELSKEIRENRPINANVLFNDFLANRVETTFAASRKGLFGRTVEKTKETPTVFLTDGRQVYALLHIEDTVFSYLTPNFDWEKIEVSFNRPPAYHTDARSFQFLAADPRVLVVPVDAIQVAALGVKVYPLAKDPFKFPTAVLIGGDKGYGEVGFKLDPAQPGYVRVDNRFFKRLFGDFAPSRGDLVFSHTGELLGIMVNNDYCAVIKDFTPASEIRTGDDLASEALGHRLDDLALRIQNLPQDLQ
jgi:hypothetical protein